MRFGEFFFWVAAYYAGFEPASPIDFLNTITGCLCLGVHGENPLAAIGLHPAIEKFWRLFGNAHSDNATPNGLFW
jgi:hypothetical protein